MICTGVTCWLSIDCPKYDECKGARKEPEDLSWFRNVYECECGASWPDEWSCTCDDECPLCGATISPSESVEIGPRKMPGLHDDY